MAIAGEPHDDVLRPLYAAARDVLPPAFAWFDAHTHVGHDPDGIHASAAELLAALDRADQPRALVFALHEPSGYPAANDRVSADAQAADGRLAWLGRVDPNAPGAIREARRCLAAGARGIKLHPRSDAFGLPHPVVDEIAALAGAARGIVLVHAGRGIPNLGNAAIALARAHPDVRIVLAHAGISDLGRLADPALALPNLLFDTSWWQVSDLMHLLAHVAPGRILHASDIPYGSGIVAGLLTLRVAREVGLGPTALEAICGGQLARILAGEEPLDLGPAPGPPPVRPRRLDLERTVAHLTAAAQTTFGGGDPGESLALARLACQSSDADPVLRCVDELVAAAQATTAVSTEAVPGEPGLPHGDRPVRWPGIYPILGAQLVAGTPGVPVV